MPSSWLQAVNPIMVIVLAPIFAACGYARAPAEHAAEVRDRMVLCGLSFVIMAFAAAEATHGVRSRRCGWFDLPHPDRRRAVPSPVGLSVTTKLAPRAFTSQMIGVWYLAVAVGDSLGGQMTRLAGTVLSEPAYFLLLAIIAGATGAGPPPGSAPSRMMAEHPPPYGRQWARATRRRG